MEHWISRVDGSEPEIQWFKELAQTYEWPWAEPRTEILTLLMPRAWQNTSAFWDEAGAQ